MTTNIQSNGSKWAGQAPDPIEALIDRLATYTLADFSSWTQNTETRHHCFFGNFDGVSAVFSIDTDEPAVIEALSAGFITQANNG